MKKNVVFLFMSSLIISLLLGGCKAKEETVYELKTEEDKTFYALGAMLGRQLKGFDLSDQELKALEKGLKDVAKGRKVEVEKLATYQKKVQEIFQKRRKSNVTKVKKKGVDYLATFLKEEGVKKTSSGLAYKVLKTGKGNHPKPTDVVEVHYHGTLIDGTVFDSSVDRKRKVSFPLNRVIKGWTEGLQLIKEGGKIKLVIPAKLGYGEHGAPPKIPGGATLVFEVELFTIKAPKKDSKKKIKNG
jgi:FKBP-type peptidyl-prolyl cis-trans isomerase FkpA